MAKIIFATDFSPVAQNAATYAIHLSRFLQLDLELFHTYIVPIAYTDSSVPLINEEEAEDISEKSMAYEKSRLHELEPQVTLTYKIVPGDLIDCLQEDMKIAQPDLIIMGTSGTNDSILWGSSAIQALRSFPVPVLTIPKDAQWHQLNKVCYAADYKKINDETPFEKIIAWTTKMHAHLSVVHIDIPNEKIPPPEKLKSSLSEKKPTYHSITSENVQEGVRNFINDNDIDWLLLVPKKYGFWKNLFHRSRTKMFAQISHIPILALPLKEN